MADRFLFVLQDAGIFTLDAEAGKGGRAGSGHSLDDPELGLEGHASVRTIGISRRNMRG